MELDGEAGPLRAIVGTLEFALLLAEAKGDVVAVASSLILDEQTLLRLLHLQITEDNGVALALEDEIGVFDVRTTENIHLQNIIPGTDREDATTAGGNGFEAQFPGRITSQNLSLKLSAKELRDGNEIPVSATDGIKCLSEVIEPQFFILQPLVSCHDVAPFVLPNGRFQKLIYVH